MNNEFTKENIVKYADDLLIGLTDEECNMVLNEFSEIKRQMELINSIPNINEVSPMSHSFDLYLAKLDEDEEDAQLTQPEVTANSSKVNANFIEVPKVVGNSEGA